MELTAEDTLRLNVLLASKPLAIRIDESRLTVHGLRQDGEALIQLNPTTRPDRYLRLVRELISGHVLSSPGGYPVYLSRWTRTGQMRADSLAQLLLLGEPEAVVAAVCSPGLDDELARRAWWAMEDAENARRMLANPPIAAAPMGRVLAEYLIDYLPFETENERIMESVRLILQPDLIDAQRQQDLWRKGARKPAFLVGFLQADPDLLPEPLPERALPSVALQLAEQRDPGALLLARVYSGAGQRFLKTVATVLAKPPTQEIVIETFACLRAYFAALRPEGDLEQCFETLQADAANPTPEIAQLLNAAPELAAELSAMRLLSGLGNAVLRPLLPDPTVLGTLMRRKLTPIMEPIQQQLALLCPRSDRR